MFEEIPWIIGFMMFSVILSYIAFRYASPPFSEIIKALAVVGIVIHELCHYFMCIITRSPVEKVTLVKKLDFKEEQRLRYYGEVQVQAHRINLNIQIKNRKGLYLLRLGVHLKRYINNKVY